SCLAAAVWLASALLPALAATPPDALPLSAEAAAEGELPRLLRAALREYTEVLPQVRRLRWLEQDAGGGTRGGHWNEATQRFLGACRQQPEVCTPLLSGQLATLDRTLNAAARPQPAPLLSALADFCEGFPGNGRPFEICGLNLRLPEAGLRWLDEGNELLFADYIGRYETERSQHLGWLQSRGQSPSPAMLSQLPELPPWLQAQLAEINGRLSFARWAWLTSYARATQADAAPAMAGLVPLALLQMARLSWRLGDAELAQALERMQAQHSGPQAAPGCALMVLSWRVDIARAHARGRMADDGATRLASMVKEGCGYTQAVFELVADALLLPEGLLPAQGAELAALLARTLQACGEAGTQCAAYRLPQLRALQTLLQGSPEARQALLKPRQAVLERLNPLPESELRLNWALGAGLLGEMRSGRPALELLLAAQRELMQRASVTQSAALEEQRDLSRFDALHRLLARAAVQQGQTLAPSRTETLRAQTLLRRLRMQRLQAELAGVQDASADTRHQAMLGQARQLRALAEGMSTHGPAFVDWLRRTADDVGAMAEQLRLEALAERRLEGQGWTGSWLTRALGFSALQRVEDQGRSLLAAETDSLARDEAYLSWLQVPGGFVATLVVPAADGGAAQTSNHWLPFGAAQQGTLKLYRELLRTGSARPAIAPGLTLRGRPVWRRSDGSHVVAGEAPAGARQVQHVED
ncbi:MAG TPA: hypothetical protein VJN44_09165, partial [Roseateles sp.]|nr:hypothetical protein [Roseateles sp.]